MVETVLSELKNPKLDVRDVLDTGGTPSTSGTVVTTGRDGWFSISLVEFGGCCCSCKKSKGEDAATAAAAGGGPSSDGAVALKKLKALVVPDGIAAPVDEEADSFGSAVSVAGTSDDDVAVDCKNENAEAGAASADADTVVLPIPDAKNEKALPEDGADVAVAGGISALLSFFLSLPPLLVVPFRSRPPNMIAVQ
jgi:hypothetical protein